MPVPEEYELIKLKKRLKQQEKKNAEIKGQLSIQRTIFANERTLMAYLRTAIAFVGVGFAAIKLSHHAYMDTIGIIFMLTGLLMSIYSVLRHLKKQRLLRRQREEYIHTSHHYTELHEREISGYGKAD